ncbi:MAG: regulatory protein RecX [Oligoflexia bacterium]|nr:regulatory protein RecX [Oligoflexia bacterium]
MEKYPLTLQQLKNKVLRLLTKRDHTVLEMKRKLKQYYLFNTSDFEAAIEWVKNLGYLPNEAAMATKWTQNLRSQGRGRRFIQGKLKAKGLKVENLKDDEEELAAARIFLQKKLKNNSLKELSFKDKQALMRKLTTRGFSVSVVRDLFRTYEGSRS